VEALLEIPEVVIIVVAFIDADHHHLDVEVLLEIPEDAFIEVEVLQEVEVLPEDVEHLLQEDADPLLQEDADPLLQEDAEPLLHHAEPLLHHAEHLPQEVEMSVVAFIRVEIILEIEIIVVDLLETDVDNYFINHKIYLFLKYIFRFLDF